MRFVSADVVNFRVIERLHVDLEPGLNLVAGPNESGKSTLVEAIGAALFVKPKGSSGFVQGMRRQGCDDAPEVTVVLDHEDGNRYRVHKRFGASGVTELSLVKGGRAGKTWRGSEADEQLDALMGGGGALEGQKIQGDLNKRWGHLCVTQGASGVDPLGGQTIEGARKEELLAILGRSAQEVVLDALDRAVREQAARRFSESWGSHAQPRPKPTSPWSMAQKEFGEAQRKHEEAVARCEALTEAQEMNQRAAIELAALKVLQSEAEGRIAEVGEQIEVARKLDSARQQVENELARLEERAKKLAEQHGTVLTLEARMGAARREEAGLDVRIAVTRGEIDRLKGELAQALADRDAAQGRASKLDERCKLLDTSIDVLRLGTEIEGLTQQQTAIELIETDLRSIEEALGEVLKVDESVLARLDALLGEQGRVQARLEGMVTRVELIVADCPVELDGKVLDEEQAVQLDRPAELVVGTHARFRLVPGGGEGLAEARCGAEEARRDYEQACIELGVTGIDQAREHKGRRDELESRLAQARAELKGRNPRRVKEQLEKCRQEQTTSKGRLDKLLEPLGEADRALAGSMDDARGERSTLESSLGSVRLQLVQLEEAVNGRQAAHDSIVERLQSMVTEHQAMVSAIRELEGRLQQASAGLADKVTREAEIASTATQVDEARRRLLGLTQQVEFMRLGKLAEDAERLRAQQHANTLRREGLLRDQARSETTLASGGSTDVRSERLLAGEDVKRVGERCRCLELEAKADRLLHEILMETENEQQQQVAGPFQERIAELLEDLFMEPSSVSVEVKGGLALDRVDRESRGGFTFDRLSTGTRQQVAAAVRLAMAQILATEHGGCLPVLFDDAFGASDAQRIDGVQRMLASAARRGLQIILLGSTPRDWTALGDCRQVELRGSQPLKRPLSSPGNAPASRGTDQVPEGWDEERGPWMSEGSWTSESREDGDTAGTLEVTSEEEELLQKFLEHVPADGAVGNISLIRKLGWPQEVYDRIKGILVARLVITTGGGRGGSVRRV